MKEQPKCHFFIHSTPPISDTSSRIHISPSEDYALPQFTRYIDIDYSGAETADSSCKGLRVYSAEGSGLPEQIQPPPSPRRYWTRRGLAEWLRTELTNETLTGATIQQTQ